MIRIVIVGLLVGRVAAAGELRSSGPLALRAPDGLVLGRDATAAVHVRAGAGISLVTSAGTLSELVPDGDELQATLTLPTDTFPQRAIVAAIDRDGAVEDWLAIPLAGQASVKVDTAARASVVVRVGAAEFGPVIADARGVANVDIVVPPGVGQATTIATAKNGAVREKPLPLGVQAFGRTLTVCSPIGDKVTVIATAPNGAPATTAPKLASSRGSLAAAKMIGKGVFVAPRAGGTDTTEVRATFAGEESVASTCTLEVPATPPSAIRLTAAPNKFVAGHGAITVAIAVDYPSAPRRLDIATIAATADLGAVAEPQRTGDGWTAVWTLPDALNGRHHALATVRAALPGGTTLSATLDVELVADAPVRIEVSAPEHVRANGATSAEVRARVVDRFGNVAPASHLAVHARGRVGSFTTGAGGSAATYVAPRTRDPGDDVIELSDPASGITGRTTVRLDALPRRFALSARAGYLSNFGRVSSPAAALAADARLPILDEHLTAGVELAGYTTNLSAEAMDASETVTGRLSVIPVIARVAYRTAAGPIDAWAGGGAGAAFVSSKLASPSAGMLEQSATRFAATGFAGAGTRVGPAWVVAELAYLYATLPADAPVAGRAGGILATAGLMFELR